MCGRGVTPDDPSIAKGSAGDGDDIETLAALTGRPAFFETAATPTAFGPATGEKRTTGSCLGVGVWVWVEWEAGEGKGGGEGRADAGDEGVEGGVEFGEWFFGRRRFGGARGVVGGEKCEGVCGRF